MDRRRYILISVGVTIASLCVVIPAIAKSGILRSAPKVYVTQKGIKEQKEPPKVVEHQVILKFKPAKINLKTKRGAQQGTDYAKGKNLKLLDLNKVSNVLVLEDKTKSTATLIEELKQDPTIESVQPNYQYYLRTTDPDYNKLWGLKNTGQTVNGASGTPDADIDAPEAWAISEGTSALVAVIDTGVAYNHPDLSNNMWDGTNCLDSNGAAQGGCISGYDFEDDDISPLPTSSSHGTHIAGTIAAELNNSQGVVGVAPHSKIMALKTSLTTAEIIQSIQFAEFNGAKIINASWGGPTYDPAMKAAIDTFDGLFITAAGNSGENHDVVTDNYPCNYASANIICVAATDQNDNLATFSDYGTKDVDVGAPGVNIYSSWAEEIVYSESFDSVLPPAVPNGYLKSGNWGTYPFGGGNNVLYGDVSHYPYLPNANSTIISPSYSLSNSTGATINFWTGCDTDYTAHWSDYMTLETRGMAYRESPPQIGFEWELLVNGSTKNRTGSGVAMDHLGNMYVASTGLPQGDPGVVKKFSPSGKYISSFGTFEYGAKILVDSNSVFVLSEINNFVSPMTVRQYTLDGIFVGQWGQFGTERGQLFYPRDFALDSNYIYILQQPNVDQGVVVKFTRDGHFVNAWGTYGTGVNQLKEPYGITVGPSGNVFVADSGNNRIKEYTPQGALVSNWESFNSGFNQPFNQPTSIEFDNQGNFVVRETGSSQYFKFNTNRELIGTWPSTGRTYNYFGSKYIHPDFIFDLSGNVIETDPSTSNFRKYVYSERTPMWDKFFGSREDGSGARPQIFDIEKSITGELFVLRQAGSDRHQVIEVYNQSGILLRTLTPYESFIGTALALDSNGNIFISSYNTVVKLNSEGAFLHQWAVSNSINNRYITTDEQDNVYITSRSTGSVDKYSNSGTFLWSRSGVGMTIPTGIESDKAGHIYVNDFGNGRIQVLSTNGDYIRQWSTGVPYGPVTNISTDNDGFVYAKLQHIVNGPVTMGKFSSNGTLVSEWNTDDYSDEGGLAIGDGHEVYLVGSSSFYYSDIGVYIQNLGHVDLVPTEINMEVDRWDEYSIDSNFNPNDFAYTHKGISYPSETLLGNTQSQFRWVTDSINGDGADGCWIDEVEIRKFNDGSLEQYGFSDGTSMATPHVVGEAALLWSIQPSLSGAALKDVILNTGDSKASLQGKTLTGKRINLLSAVKELSKAKLSNLPSAITSNTSASITVGGYDVDTYRYSIDGGVYSTDVLVGSPITLTGLSEGNHTIKVVGKGSANYWQTDDDATSYTWKVDSNAPTASISYSTIAVTNQDVIATLLPTEPVTVTNNGGSLTRIFSENGSFTFTFVDAAGNTGSAMATVGNIDKTPPPPPPAPVIIPPTPTTTAVSPIPQVLGTTTFHPIIRTFKNTTGAFSIKYDGRTISLRPFGASYKGTVWARSIDFGPDGKIYVFINSQPYSRGQIRVYKANGKLLKAYSPYGGFATSGLNATAISESNDKVYLAVGTTKAGTTAKTYQVTVKGLKTLNSLKASNSSGNIRVEFKKLYKNQYGLVTIKGSDRTTLKVWKLNLTTNKFVEDKRINKTKIKI